MKLNYFLSNWKKIPSYYLRSLFLIISPPFLPSLATNIDDWWLEITFRLSNDNFLQTFLLISFIVRFLDKFIYEKSLKHQIIKFHCYHFKIIKLNFYKIYYFKQSNLIFWTIKLNYKYLIIFLSQQTPTNKLSYCLNKNLINKIFYSNR